MAAVDLDELETLAKLAADNYGKGYRQASWGPRDVEIVLALITELRTLRASAAEGQREWIATSERMPEATERVWIFSTGRVYKAEYNGEEFVTPSLFSWDRGEVTHWMHRSLEPQRPSPPEKGESK